MNAQLRPVSGRREKIASTDLYSSALERESNLYGGKLRRKVEMKVHNMAPDTLAQPIS